MTAAVQFVDQARGSGLGASIAGACLGVSPYLSPIGAFLKLTGKTSDTGSRFSEWGTILEPVLRGYYKARHRVEIFVPTASVYHPLHPWLRCTPDGVVNGYIDLTGDGPRVVGDRLVQCKTVDQRLNWHWGLSPRQRSAPPHYRVQAVVEMAVTGLDRCDFAVLCGGNDYFEVITERDAELEAVIVERLAAFWRGVERNVPPAIDDADDWRAYFADRLPKVRTQVIAPAKVETLLKEWKLARDLRERCDAYEAKAKNLIMAAAVEDEATTYETSHGRVLVVQPKNGSPYIKAPTDWGDKDITP